MILPDVGILLYAYDSSSPRHAAARAYWAALLSGKRAVGMPWEVLQGYVRIATHPRATRKPLRVDEAERDVRAWLARPQVQIIQPTERHADVLFGLLRALGAAGNLTTAAHLAALSIEYNAEIASSDVDFGRFPGVRWVNPLAG